MVTDTIQDTYEILEAFKAQKKYAPQVALTTATERITKLKKLREAILKYQTEIQDALYQDFKKPSIETDITEIFPTTSGIKHAISHLRKWMKPKRVPTPLTLVGTSSFIHHEPKGQALIIAPWNYPFYLLISPLIYAISAGNVAILKPSEMTPNTSKIIAKIITELFDKQEFVVIEGGVEVSTKLLKLPFSHIYFTGSPAVGKIIMKSASQHLASVTLELGGKSPAIVDKSADLQDVAEKLIWGKCLNAGQTCVAPDYVFVKKSQKYELVKLLTKQIKKSYLSHSASIQESSDYARIINAKHFQRVTNLIADAIEKGAKIEFGGKMDMSDNYLEPTILTELSEEMQIMQDEIFAPVLPVLTYENLDEVYDYIARKPKPLALYAFGKNRKNLDEIVENTTAGSTCINDCIVHVSHHDLPFGGVNNSGIGESNGVYGFEAFSNKRSVLRQRVGYTVIKLFYPPYTPKVQKLKNLLMKFLG